MIRLGRLLSAQGGDPYQSLDGARGLDFSAETGTSGTDIPDGRIIRKRVNAIIRHLAEHFGTPEPEGVRAAADKVARMGAPPFAVSIDGEILGVIALSDVIKPGIRERIAQLRAMGIRTIMVTGDNPITAHAITAEAGLDDFVAEAKPEDKLRLIAFSGVRNRCAMFARNLVFARSAAFASSIASLACLAAATASCLADNSASPVY